MKCFGFVTVMALTGSILCAQSVYVYDIKKDAVIGALALGMFISPFLGEKTPDKVPASLQKSDVNSFDRRLMFPRNKVMDYASDYGVYSMTLVPFLMAIPIHGDALLTHAIMCTEAFFLAFGTEALLKNRIIRYRPYMYFDGVPSDKENDYYKSLPSGAATFAFLGATFLSVTFSQQYPDSAWKLPIVIGVYGFAVGASTMRITSGSHFLSDVLLGAAIGSFSGWVIPFLHKKRNTEHDLALYVTGNGILLSLSL